MIDRNINHSQYLKNCAKVYTNYVFIFRYLRQVLDETMRCSVLAPYAARVQDMETELGGHKLPPKVQVTSYAPILRVWWTYKL